MALHDLTACQQADALRSGEVTVVELTEHYLERTERLNPDLGAFVTVTADLARERARFVQERVPRTAPLWGMPLGDKDLWARAGVPTRYGSRLMANHVPEASDDIVATLDRAGAISLGKTSTPEFGLPSHTEPLAGPIARNPWDRALGTGGSSGGAAGAVAAGMLPFVPGSDGGGSIRIPAAACGLVGLKPSRGRVPDGSGIDALGGLPVAGPIARTVADAGYLLDGMIARTASGEPDDHFALRAPHSGPFVEAADRLDGRYRLGAMTTSAWDAAYDIRLEPEALAAFQHGIDHLAALGHDVADTSLSSSPVFADAFRTIWQAGASQLPAGADQRSQLEPLTQWLVARGQEVTGGQLVAALSTLKTFERSFIAQFAEYDAVLTPALAMTPRPIGWYDADDAERNFAQQVQYTPFTSMINVCGLPAITLPTEQTAGGLPMGIHLIGRPGGEQTLLALGAQLEDRIGWQNRHPDCW